MLHNDDTSMRVLRLEREPSDQRTGVFTSGIVATDAGRKIALHSTGRQHAGENLARKCLTAHRKMGARSGDAALGNVPRPLRGRGDFGGQLPGPWPAPVVEAAQSFPRSVATRSKRWAALTITTRRRVRRVSQPRSVCGFTSKTARRYWKNCTAGCKGNWRKRRPNPLSLGQGDQLYAAALERTDGISAPTGLSDR